MLVPLAVDVARGWVLLPDGGTRLGDRVGSDDLAAALCDVLPQYAELQRALAPSAEEILALGAPDMRPQVMPQRFEEALEATARSRVAATSTRASPRGAGTWRSGAPGSRTRQARSAWTTTTCTPGTSSAPARSASTTGATASSRTRSRACCSRSPTCATGPTRTARLRLRDAYLEAWSDLAPHAELVETLELAVRVGWIARSHTWLRAVGDASEDRWATAPLESLAAIL